MKKKQREEEEKLKQDTAMNVQWDKTAQRWVETEEEVGEKSCFNCCSRSTKQKPKKKKGKSMKEKAQDKGLKCMFALPGCIKRAIKKTCLCFAGTIQCILCAPKLAEGMEMQTQVNPEN